jgi:YidC/Oxa1 family membrane protein insertase
MTGDNKNFLLAIVMSAMIIFSWQYFYAGPKQEALKQQMVAQQAQQSATTPAAPAGTTAGAPAAVNENVILPRDEALALSPRVAIETPSLAGSINLQGGRLDDLQLKNYRETVSPTSPMINLLSPSATELGFFAEDGYVAATGTTAKLPDSKTIWTAPAQAKLTPTSPVTLTYDNGEGLIFSKTIAVDENYLFTITRSVENKSTAPVALLAYSRLKRNGTPKTENIFVLHEGLIGVTEGKLTEIKYNDLKEDAAPVEAASTGGWAGFTDKYWAATLIPANDAKVKTGFRYDGSLGRDSYQADFIAQEATSIAPGASATNVERLFAGAKVVQIINGYHDALKLDHFDLMIDWGWFYFFTKPLFWLLEMLKAMTGNFGVAILLATVLIKIAFYPLANKSYESMSKMKKLQPEMERLKTVYPDDRMKQQQELMILYKKEKVSPLSGCLPMLVQIPVFFALYKVIYVTIEMRHAPFFGWIQDLSAPDPTNLFTLFGLIDWAPPSFLMLGIWPIVMGVTMWVQMRLNPTPPDPVQAQLFNWMPVLFTFMLGMFPAGLVIYWAWNNTLSIIQQATIMKRQGVEINLLGNIRESLPFLKKAKS